MASLFLYMGMCMYAPSLALSTVTNLSTVASIAIMGVVCTFYITIGGVKAVVYTDVLQTLIMLAGTVVVTVLCCYDLGGVGEVWTIADQGQRLQFFNLDPSPFIRHTFWSTIVLGFYNTLAVVGLGQAAFQRLASVSHLSTAVRLCWVFLLGVWSLFIIFFFCGLVAYAEYSECDPLAAGLTTKADQIIPFLVMDKLGHLPGLPGLFVAAVYGGVLR
ncbi:hypothetical protein Pcinc_024862 [Petrolisthes cinctipes]|uniref:Sodium-coupled monocarboxylate transporter 1 n=1 Tax=Petrolisthes cinctipes TaxID=88211 RepID=A0AAE1KDU7_PETCI|nr:hypothetical protein Pcinc_024862 [Petrolisthes cinctipes]